MRTICGRDLYMEPILGRRSYMLSGVGLIKRLGQKQNMKGDEML